MSKVAVIHDNRDKGGDLGVVAFLDFEWNGRLTTSDILAKAFDLTNNGDRPWCENSGVTKMFPGDGGCRSTMVGDFVLIGNMKWKCEPDGWKEV